MKQRYNGTVEWHDGKPERSGKYLISMSDWTDAMFYDKKKDLFITELESENGGNITFSNVNGWAYLPEPRKLHR